jgi:DNA-binding Lrp family transcriptional regulator
MQTDSHTPLSLSFVRTFFKIIEVSKKEKEVKELYTSTGDHIILTKVVFRTNEKLNEFVKKLEKIK